MVILCQQENPGFGGFEREIGHFQPNFDDSSLLGPVLAYMGQFGGPRGQFGGPRGQFGVPGANLGGFRIESWGGQK